MEVATQKKQSVVTPLSSLRWYTGYYSLVATGTDTVPQGAFLQIISSANQNSLFDIASIVISIDGVTAEKYTSGFTIDNVDNTITIPGICLVTLTKNNTESGVSSLQGTIKNIAVTGVNYLSPVPLEVLAGSYKNPLGDEILSINQNPLHISPVFNISFDFGQGLQVITEYTYDPTMYLLSFNNSAADNYVLMLGTGEGKGLACYVVGAGNPIENTVLYTIPSGQ